MLLEWLVPKRGRVGYVEKSAPLESGLGLPARKYKTFVDAVFKN